ncbi:MAG: hypothetical protein J6D18_01660, partial [Erysipelotrichaceae bacterium]|nr:hypothetical protein [Erysipelotrichaceae bacterium]
VSDNKGFIVTGQLEPGVTYTLHEVSAPTGYLPAEDVTFTVNETAAMSEVWMIDIKQPQPEPKPEPQPDPEKEEPVKEEKKEVVTAHRIQTGVADGSLIFMGMSFLSLMGIGWIVKMNH